MAHQTFFKSDMVTRVDDARGQSLADDRAWRKVCFVVDMRDERQCRCCDRRTNCDDLGILRGHRHHIIYASAGGPDESWNLCTLCATCHNDEHVKRTLRIEGNADQKLTFWRMDADGTWYIARQELAVRLVEQD